MSSSLTTKHILTWTLAAFFLMSSVLALAVVRLTDPQGNVAPNQKVMITLPGGTPEEAESDDDGILFWWRNGKKVQIGSLPAGTKFSGNFGAQLVQTGMSGGVKTALVIATLGTAAVISNGDSGSNASTPTTPDTGGGGDDDAGSGGDDDGGDPPAPQGALSISGSSCTLDCVDGESVGSSGSCMFDLFNSGDAGCTATDYSVDSSPTGVGVSPASGTLQCGESATVDAFIESPCSSSATSGDIVFSCMNPDGSSCSGTSFPVSVIVNPPQMMIGRGELVVEGSIIIDLGIHNSSGTDCQEPRDTRVFRNDGDQEIEVTLTWNDNIFNINGDTDQTTVTIPPGGTIEVVFNFNCNFFGGSFGENSDSATVTVRDAEGNLDGPGSFEMRVTVE